MEKNALTTGQVLAITKIEYLISIFYKDPESVFLRTIELIDEHQISGHEETMIYLYELLVHQGYIKYAEEFAKKYNIQTEKLDKV
jgi:hypothetical protein